MISINPLHPNISMHILHTLPWPFYNLQTSTWCVIQIWKTGPMILGIRKPKLEDLKALTNSICLTIKAS